MQKQFLKRHRAKNRIELYSCLLLAHFSDVTLELPFALTHPEPNEKVVCGMVTLPRKPEDASRSKEEVDKPATVVSPAEVQGAEG